MTSRTTPYICMESSRVGEMTSTPVPFLGLNLARWSSSTLGMRNARVLPDPAVPGKDVILLICYYGFSRMISLGLVAW